MLPIKLVVILCIALGLYIYEIPIKKILYFLAIFCICNICVNLAINSIYFNHHRCYINGAVVNPGSSSKDNQSRIHEKNEIGYIFNETISNLVNESNEPIYGLYVHHIMQSVIELPYNADLKYIDLKYIDVKTKIKIICNNADDIRCGHVSNSTITIECLNDVGNIDLSYIKNAEITVICNGNIRNVDLRFIENSTITIICKGNDNYPINKSYIRKGTHIETNSKNIIQLPEYITKSYSLISYIHEPRETHYQSENHS